MAFEVTNLRKLGLNLFNYKTTDDIADVLAANYFADTTVVNGLSIGDVIFVHAADGFTVTAVATLGKPMVGDTAAATVNQVQAVVPEEGG